MRTVLVRLMFTFVSVAFLAAYHSSAVAQSFDHLKCYKVKDNQRPFVANEHSVDLVPEQNPPFDDEQCVVKMKAKFFCIDVRKENVQPAPPGAPPGPEAVDYVCYKFKGRCTPAVPSGTVVEITDQFASGPIEIKKAGMLCAPANNGPLPTSTTSSSTSSTTTITYLGPPCGLYGNAPQCDAYCPAGQTCVSTGSSCECQPATAPCGTQAGVPECYGDCPPANPVCRDSGGSCQCWPY